MIPVDEKDIDRITAALHALMKGKKAVPIDLPQDYPENEFRQVV